MGCRHAQSLLSKKDKFEIYVIEPSQEAIRINSQRIGVKDGEIFFYHSIDKIKNNIDVAIIASSSNPRYSIVKELLEKGIKRFLLEKIVFQSGEQFEEIISISQKCGAQLYCNFVNRFFSVYNEIKDLTDQYKGPMKMTVYGGNFGLGCNAIHYIDLFSYLTGEYNDIKVEASELIESEEGNKRGSIYKEFAGVLSISYGKLNKLLVIADPTYQGGITIHITWNQSEYLISEQTQRYISHLEKKTTSKAFEITPTSKLTARIVEEILNGSCILTTLSQTRIAHEILFDAFNGTLFELHSWKTICPIT